MNKLKNIKPVAGYIIIDTAKPEERTKGGIFLPENSREIITEGSVLAVGPDEITDSGIKKKSPVKVGDYIIYGGHGGIKINIGKEEVLFVRFDEVLAIIEK